MTSIAKRLGGFGALALAVVMAAGVQQLTSAYLPASVPTYKTGSASLNFPSMTGGGTSGATQKLTIAVPGAVVGNPVVLGPPASFDAGLSATGFVSATNVVTVQLDNVSTPAVDPSAAPWTATVLQK